MPHKLDTLVELEDQYSNVYPMSPSGARGWVRARRELPKADPEVFIEWDKTHWRYHGEKDGWTFEHHFRLVEDATSPPEDLVMPTMDKILADATRQVDAEVCPGCGEPHDSSKYFIDTLIQAQEAALGSDAYFIVTVTPRIEGDLSVFEPQVYSESLNPVAKGLIETQLAHIVAQLFEEHMLDHFDDMGDGYDPRG